MRMTVSKALGLAAILSLSAGVAHAKTAEDLGLGGFIGKNKEEITAALQGKGYEVRKVKTEDGLFEAYAKKDGEKYEVFVDPNSGEVVRIEDD